MLCMSLRPAGLADRSVRTGALRGPWSLLLALGGTNCTPASQGNALQVSGLTPVMRVPTRGGPSGLAPGLSKTVTQ